MEEKVASVAPPWWTPPKISIAGTASDATKYHNRICQQAKNDPKHLLMYSDGSDIKGRVGASSWCPKLNRQMGADLPPPLCARASGFVFSLDSILKEADGGLSVNSRAPVNKLAARDRWSAFLDSILDKPEPDGRLSLDPRASVDDVAIIDELEAQTELDREQCQALIAALTREFAFIQGPPGTGKSALFGVLKGLRNEHGDAYLSWL